MDAYLAAQAQQRKYQINDPGVGLGYRGAQTQLQGQTSTPIQPATQGVPTSMGGGAEQWRSQLAKVFPADQVNKMLYVIQHESGGNAGAVGDSGHSYGLFQSQSPRNSVATPQQQIEDAYHRWQARGYKDWGENNSYQGHRFGSLGNHPYPGG